MCLKGSLEGPVDGCSAWWPALGDVSSGATPRPASRQACSIFRNGRRSPPEIWAAPAGNISGTSGKISGGAAGNLGPQSISPSGVLLGAGRAGSNRFFKMSQEHAMCAKISICILPNVPKSSGCTSSGPASCSRFISWAQNHVYCAVYVCVIIIDNYR